MALSAVRIENYVATLTLFPAAEGVSRALIDELSDVCASLAAETAQAHAIVVRCEPAFPSQWHARELQEPVLDALLRPLGAGFEALANLPQPTIAAVNGNAHSAGFELALACDIRVADADTTFAMPETGLGLVPLGGATQRLPRAVGRSQALRLLLAGIEVDANEAKRIGLVTEVAAAGSETEAAQGIARVIASRGPVATRFVKEAVHRGLEQPLQQGLRTELDMTVILQTTADRAEGVRAFVEGRPPQFTGR